MQVRFSESSALNSDGCEYITGGEPIGGGRSECSGYQEGGGPGTAAVSGGSAAQPAAQRPK